MFSRLNNNVFDDAELCQAVGLPTNSKIIFELNVVSQINRLRFNLYGGKIITATFLDELKDLAEEKKHSTVKEAALLAKEGNVEKLILKTYQRKKR